MPTRTYPVVLTLTPTRTQPCNPSIYQKDDLFEFFGATLPDHSEQYQAMIESSKKRALERSQGRGKKRVKIEAGPFPPPTPLDTKSQQTLAWLDSLDPEQLGKLSAACRRKHRGNSSAFEKFVRNSKRFKDGDDT